ncbi:MAG: TolB family protein, partial [Anaerolineales bacterium]
DNQPIVLVPANAPQQRQTVSGENQRGQRPVLEPNGERFAWAQWQPGSRTLTIQIQTFTQPLSTNVVTLYDNDPIIDRHNYPNWGDNRLVFSAQALGAPARDLWMLNIPPEAGLNPELSGSQLARLTSDAANETWSAFTPDHTALVYVETRNEVTDLMRLNLANLERTPLTQNANELIESAPDVSVDNEVVFAARAAEDETSDIYIIPLDGSAAATQVIDLGPQDIQPRFSPDGRYIVFSSDVAGNWDVFIFDRETEAFYAMANDPNSIDIANDWRE